MSRHSPKFESREILQRTAAYFVLMLLSTITILPFVFMLLVSLDGKGEWGWAPTAPPRLIPDPPTLRFYAYVLSAFNFVRYFINSAIMTAGITLGNLVFGTLAGYAFARINFKGRDLIFAALLGTMMIPSESLVIPQYLIVQRLGWLNTYAGLIVPSMVSVFGIFLMREFIRTIPASLEEAAMIDGCNRLGVFMRIVVPLMKPALVTLAIITFVQSWNTFLWPLIVAQRESMFTLQIGLASFREQRAAEWSALMAGTAIAMLPTTVLFLSLQRYYIQGLIMGATKG